MILKNKAKSEIQRKEANGVRGPFKVHGVKLFGTTPNLQEVEYTVFFAYPREISAGETITDVEVRMICQ